MIIFHIDVNNAFLSWESVYRLREEGETLDLRTVAAVIGGSEKTRHGIVLAKSPIAKTYGIKTAETLSDARKKCPNLLVVPPRHDIYRDFSHRLIEYLKSLTDTVEQFSIDEAFADMTGSELLQKYSAVEAANFIRTEVEKRFGFTVNIGISSNKLLAKMASDFEKPDKVHTLFPEEVPLKMWPLPINELFMAGKSSVDTMKKLEINTIGDLAKADPALIELHLKSHGRMLWNFANGIDDSQVQSKPLEAKGIGNSTTLSEDAATYEEVQKVFKSLAQSVGGRLKKAGQKAMMVSMEVKYHNFQTMSHQRQLSKPTDKEEEIYDAACQLFLESWNGEPVRLLGIRTAKLVDASEPEQLSLFDIKIPEKPDEKHQKLNKAMEEIRKKFGDSAVMKASEMK